MNTLFIDTSSSTLSVALITDDKVISTREINSINEHSKYTINEIKEIFNDCGIDPKEINQIMVTNGPGSFTGLRIGVTIAKTYAWTLNIPVIPISTLKAYALSNTNNDYYISVIDARRSCVYAGIYDGNYNEYLNDQYISIKELNTYIDKLNGKLIVIGNISINDINTHVAPILDVQRIYDYCKNDKGINAHELVPTYLKKVEAEEKLECINND